MRKPVTWSIHGGSVLGPAPFFVAGIVNVTPDSFYDGGRHAEHGAAVAHGLKLLEDGAQILDVGGESTRPYADPVDAETEKVRVLPVVSSLAERLAGRPDAGISIGTDKAEVAAEAINAGAEIVNDVSACRFDPALAEVIAGEKPGYVLMHSLGRPAEMQSAPAYDDVVEDVLAFFEERLAVLTAAGLPEENVVLDPGIGFGKTLEHNLALIRGIERFHALGRPLYIGISNKSLWGKLLNLEADERGPANMAATIYLAERGVAVHRVHDASAAAGALRALDRISAPDAKVGMADSREGGLHV